MRVFLSHAGADRDIARQIADGVRACGHEVWSDDSIVPGASFSEAIAEALRRADAFVVLVTQSLATSEWARFEVGAAIASERPVIPVVLDAAAETPPLLRDVVALDLTDPESRSHGIARLCDALAHPVIHHVGRDAIELWESGAATLATERTAHEARYELSYRRAATSQALVAAVGVLVAVLVLVGATSGTVLALVVTVLVGAGAGFFLGARWSDER